MGRIPPCGEDVKWHSREREQPVQRPGSDSLVKSTWGAAHVLGDWGVGVKLCGQQDPGCPCPGVGSEGAGSRGRRRCPPGKMPHPPFVLSVVTESSRLNPRANAQEGQES